MHLLILGGTRFVGRAIVEEALSRGHQVTLVHRGQSGADLFPSAEHVLTNRDGGLGVLDGRSFDAVIDVCGYVPRLVRDSAEFFKGKAERYQFISTISVYDIDQAGPHDEDANRYAPLLDGNETIDKDTYGPLKVACEDVIDEVWGDDGFNLRPGLVCGPHDPTGRFTYWVEQIAAGGEVQVPEDLEQPVQVVDARDLAWFSIHQIENGFKGPVHVTGDERTFGQMLEEIRAALGSGAAWVPGAVDKPLVVPNSKSSVAKAPLFQMDLGKAKSHGLILSDFAKTVRDTWDWAKSQPKE